MKPIKYANTTMPMAGDKKNQVLRTAAREVRTSMHNLGKN